MPHYFFHLDECGAVTTDTEGRDFDTIEAAHHAAIKDARAIMCGELAEGQLCLGCFIDIKGAQGEHLGRVRFEDAVRVSGATH